jgi:hypothetical protein
VNVNNAIILDRNRDVEGAALAYEGLLEERVQGDILANLLALYWQATDFGFARELGLKNDFIERAEARLWDLLDNPVPSYRSIPEYYFWTRYIKWADLGEEFSPDECAALVQKYPDYREPIAFIFIASNGRELEAEARQLLDRYISNATVRSSYVASLISSVLRQKSAPVFRPLRPK